MGGSALIGFAARRPLACAALLFCAGVGLGPLDSSWPTTLCLAGAGVLLATAFAASRPLPGLATLLLLVAFLGAGAGSAGLRAHTHSALATDLGEELLEGRVEGPIQLVEGATRFRVAVSRVHRDGRWIEARYRARLTSPEPIELLPGDRVRARVRLRAPRPRLNPGAPDLQSRWRAEGLAGSGTVLDGQLIVFGDPPGLARALERYRGRYRETVEAAVPDREAAALIRALAMGDRAELSDEANEDFSASGLAHILSVSGLHIAVVAAGLYRALRWLLSRSERLLLAADVRALAAVAAIPATWAYVLLAGAEVPAVRSGLMTSVLFLSYGLRRDPDHLTSLGAALLAVLAWDPAALRAVSFQLSFAAVIGLALLARPLRGLVPVQPPSPGATGARALLARGREALLQVGCASLAASLATAPLAVAVFHRTSLVAVVSNAVALPVASGLTVLAAGSALVSAAGSLAAAPLLLLADPLARGLLWLSRAFASVPFASPFVAAPSTLTFLAWYAALAAIPLLAHRRRLALRIAVPALLVLAAPSASRALRPLTRADTLSVTFLAAGQGDAAVVMLPGGRALLIDGGGEPVGGFDTGARVVLPALLELGAYRLEAAVLSHPHPDHGLGLASVIERLPTRELWLAPGAERSELGMLAVERLRGWDGRLRILSAGARSDAFAPARIEVLHPPPTGFEVQDNDASLVLRISLGEVSFLFPGDIERHGEQALAALGDARADVLKAPHHGSSTSSSESFVRLVSPGHVVFCVGRNNRFGFPHAPVLARYERAGCQIHRTDRHGAVTFRTDGVRLQVEHFR